MSNLNIIALKIVLILLGLYGIFLGLDFGLGGFTSLGWQGTTAFIEVTDAARYAVQDNNFRFLGGVFIGVGVFVLFAVTNLRRYQQSLNLIFALILMGGLTRFSVGSMETLLIPEIIVALVVEIGLMIGLYFWLRRAVSQFPTPR